MRSRKGTWGRQFCRNWCPEKTLQSLRVANVPVCVADLASYAPCRSLYPSCSDHIRSSFRRGLESVLLCRMRFFILLYLASESAMKPRLALRWPAYRFGLRLCSRSLTQRQLWTLPASTHDLHQRGGPLGRGAGGGGVR